MPSKIGVPSFILYVYGPVPVKVPLPSPLVSAYAVIVVLLNVLLEGLQLKGAADAAPTSAVGSRILAGTLTDVHPLLLTTSTS